MPKHGTAYELGQYNEVLVAVTRALPSALEGTDPKIIIPGLQNRGEALGLTLRSAITQVAVLQYPADNEEFELTLDGNASENDPIEMVRMDGYSSPEKWKHTGKRVHGVQTRRFKLVRAGDCRNLDEVRQNLAQYGETPEGQWRQAFKAKYSKPDGNGPVGVADPSWVYPLDDVNFPCVDSDGDSSFDWAAYGHDEGWRWLVPASK